MRNSDKPVLIKIIIILLLFLAMFIYSCSPKITETLTEPSNKDWRVVKVDEHFYWRQNSATMEIVKCKKNGLEYKVGTFIICPDYLRNSFSRY